MSALSNQTRDKLKTVSTATICTALFKRGLNKHWLTTRHEPQFSSKTLCTRGRCITHGRI